ncbi:MAG: quinone oxidoreductase [Chloroflexota bacterium]|nr:quinone oxidoreductase [Chloroflexota bacterium]
MRAVEVAEPGGREVLALVERHEPSVGPGDVLVRVRLAGVNFMDVHMRSGAMPTPLPLVLGVEGVGTVEALGEGVANLHVGQRVAYPFATRSGSYAELHAVPAALLVEVPDDFQDEQAVAVMLQGLTAHALAFSVSALEAGSVVLVHSAAGGVGALVVQLLARQSRRVIGAVFRVEKVPVAEAAGADEVLVYDDGWPKRVRELTGGKGVDLILDAVGEATFDGDLVTAAPLGKVALYGSASGAVPLVDPMRLLIAGSLSFSQLTVQHYIAIRELLECRTGELFKWLVDGSLKVRVQEILPLDRAADAHRLMEERRTVEKLLLAP